MPKKLAGASVIHYNSRSVAVTNRSVAVANRLNDKTTCRRLPALSNRTAALEQPKWCVLTNRYLVFILSQSRRVTTHTFLHPHHYGCGVKSSTVLRRSAATMPAAPAHHDNWPRLHTTAAAVLKPWTTQPRPHSP